MLDKNKEQNCAMNLLENRTWRQVLVMFLVLGNFGMNESTFHFIWSLSASVLLVIFAVARKLSTGKNSNLSARVDLDFLDLTPERDVSF